MKKDRLLERVYRRLLREAEEPIWGKVAFGEDRIDDVDWETDTEEEHDAYRALSNHFRNNLPMTPKDALKIMAAEETGLYNDVLHPPPVEYVYRGISVSEQMLEKLIGRKLHEDEKVMGVGPVPGYFGARGQNRESSAWTQDPLVAVNFSAATGTNYSDSCYNCVVVAKVADNPSTFLAGAGGLYRVHDFAAFPTEDEVVAVGGARGCKVYWHLWKRGISLDDACDALMNNIKEKN